MADYNAGRIPQIVWKTKMASADCPGSGKPWHTGMGNPICPVCHIGPRGLKIPSPSKRRPVGWTGEVPAHQRQSAVEGR
jgi:hypothetical protein